MYHYNTILLQRQHANYLHCLEFPSYSYFMQIQQTGTATTITNRVTPPTTPPIIALASSELSMHQKDGFIYSYASR